MLAVPHATALRHPDDSAGTIELAAGTWRAGYEVAIDRAILRDLIAIAIDSALDIPDRRHGKNSPSSDGPPSADAANRLRCQRRVPVTHGAPLRWVVAVAGSARRPGPGTGAGLPGRRPPAASP
jgi:hypothetical protein